jgi:hypothetical protein
MCIAEVGGRGGGVVVNSPKIPTKRIKSGRGGVKIKVIFLLGVATYILYRTRWLHISDKMLYLHMGYEISLQNRLSIGFALGWSYFPVDNEFDYSELVLYLGLLSLHIKKQKL